MRSSVDRGALDEAQAAQVADLLQFEAQDALGGGVQPRHLLRARPRLLTSSMLRSDSVVEPASAVVSATITLHLLDPPRERRAQPAEQRHRHEVHRRDQPVDGEGVDHHEERSRPGLEQHVDHGRHQPLHVGAHLLQLAQGLAAALVLEQLVRQLQRVAGSRRSRAARPVAGSPRSRSSPGSSWPPARRRPRPSTPAAAGSRRAGTRAAV